MLKKSISVVLLAAFLFGLSACASTTNTESTGQYIDSATITTKVKSGLADKVGISTLRNITVTTYKGVVQLSGFVSTQQEVQEAVQVAQSVPGVTQVANSLLVRQNLPSK